MSAALALITTGLAKVLSALGPARAFTLTDPILGLSFRTLIPLVGVFELAIAFLCLSRAIRARIKLGLLAWMSTVLLLYRCGLWFVNWHHPCACMGSLAGLLGLSDKLADNIMKGLLAYLLAGSYVLLLHDWSTLRFRHSPAHPREAESRTMTGRTPMPLGGE
ncbi:MAG: hypothetical protein ACLQVX_03290 [Limisphaerales bacterium]